MKKTVTIRGLTIGEGAPKICVSLMGSTLTEITEEALYLKKIDVDVVEWRSDFFVDVEDRTKVKEALVKIRAILTDIPLIFTFRSRKEGGEKELRKDYYFALNKAVIETGLVDLIDVELFNDENKVLSLVEAAHSHDVFVIISNHDFNKTPTKEEMVSRLRKAQELGADLLKIAVMPTSTADVITLLDATNTMSEQFADRPIITMSMGDKGVISRLAGEVFGSALTFGAAKKPSAPGQVAVADLRTVLNLLHSN
jgi:3-dehydroquinate dehydratase-1